MEENLRDVHFNPILEEYDWDTKAETKKALARIQELSDQRDEHLETLKKLENAILEQHQLLEGIGIQEQCDRLAKEAAWISRWHDESEAYLYTQH